MLELDNALSLVVKGLENTTKEFGFKVPIIIDTDNVIVAGHTRLKAALKLGLDKVPCIKADDLTEEQLKAFRLADNKVSELASWDFDKLEEELAELEMDMSAFGFVEEDEEEPKERKDLSDNVNEMYQVIIDCEDEEQQAVIFERLKEEGYKCHVLTL